MRDAGEADMRWGGWGMEVFVPGRKVIDDLCQVDVPGKVK